VVKLRVEGEKPQQKFLSKTSILGDKMKRQLNGYENVKQCVEMQRIGKSRFLLIFIVCVW